MQEPAPPPPPGDAAGASLPAFIAFLGAAVALLLADPFPWRLRFVTPSSLHALVVASEVVFVLFALPFLDRAGTRGAAARAALLPLAALPLALLAGNISAAAAGAVVRGQVLVFALAALVATLRAGDPRRAPAYLLAAFLLAGGLPVAAFVAAEFGRADLGWLALFSPVWAALEPGSWTSLALAGAAAAGAALRMILDRPEAAA